MWKSFILASMGTAIIVDFAFIGGIILCVVDCIKKNKR